MSRGGGRWFLGEASRNFRAKKGTSRKLRGKGVIQAYVLVEEIGKGGVMQYFSEII